MKKFFFKFLFLQVFFLLSCSKNETTCEPTNVTCNETVPTNELCQAYFTRWFFDKNTNSCSQKSYSGCSQKGFETKVDCENCKCR